MKDIQEYKGTNTVIHVTSLEEFRNLIPELNKILRGWEYERHCGSVKDCGYISIPRDCWANSLEIETFNIVQAREFLQATELLCEIY